MSLFHNHIHIPTLCLTVLLLLAGIPRATAGQTVESGDTSRPKVAVVLAGGGAKGVAHIGALKVIEEAGLPIDIIVGNSMGAIVGGLYSIGYTPEEMDSIVRTQDWIRLLLDTPDRQEEKLSLKKQYDHYLLHIPFDEKKGESWHNTGVIRGKNITTLLGRLTASLPDTVDFDRLPVRFCAIATDVIGGQIYEFHSGNLVEAMRSSMAIPGVFTPVKKDSMLLVDGCILNNFPVDVAIAMGAGIVIGIDLENDADVPHKLTNMVDMLTHIMDVTCNRNYKENISNSDVYIPIDVKDYTAASFSSKALDSLITRGERSTRLKLDELNRLKEKFSLTAGQRPACISAVRPETATVPEDLDTEKKKKAAPTYINGALSLGARFDTEEYASVMLHANLPISERRHTHLAISGRLGQRIRGSLLLNHELFDIQHFSIGYDFEHNVIDYHDHGDRAAEITDNHNRVRIQSWQSWKKARYSVGAQFDLHHYSDILVDRKHPGDIPAHDDEHYFTYYAQVEFNNQNATYFPTTGSTVEGRCEIISDNLYQYRKQNPFPIFSGYWQTAISLNSRFTFLPSAAARVILYDKEPPFALRNMVGGLARGHKAEHQMPISGLAYTETVDKAVICTGIEVRQRMGANHFIYAQFDAASISQHLESAFNNDTYCWGMKGGYAYRSLVGPLSAFINYNSRTKQAAFFLNVGYYF